MTGGTEESWVSRELEAMAVAWANGKEHTAALVLQRHPEAEAEAAIRLIYEEVCLRREAGLVVDTSEVVHRYPRWQDEIRSLLECDRLLGPDGPVGPWPVVGEELGPFRLLAELGRGASGATYLARDAALADRPVVVKVTRGDQEEHLALAMLRHTHIVPLFSEHAFPERGLRALCMPYLGGASLARILQGVAESPQSSRSGRLLVQLIDREMEVTDGAIPEAPFRRALERETYVRAVIWIAACLADALDYAHARGLVHMDVKPSNILVTVDGQPMLLDFHLARPSLRQGDRVFDQLGGTPEWMAPEQRAAMEAVTRGLPVPLPIDGRADTYSLGLILRQALTGPGPRNDRRGVGPGLTRVIDKCLSPDPRNRYPNAAALADDLRRHLNDLPLKGIADRNPVERLRKWRLRNPGALAWIVAGASLLLVVALGVLVAATERRRIVGQLESAIESARRDQDADRFSQALATLARALDESRGAPGVGALRTTLRREIQRAQGAMAVQSLHQLAELVRYRYGVDPPSLDDARTLAEQCRTIWAQRGHLRGVEGPLASRSDTDADADAIRQVQSDLVEVVAVWADVLVRLAPTGEDASAREEALERLDEAEAEFGPSLALDLCRARLGGPPVTAPPPGRGATAWEHYDLGRDHLRSGKTAEAEAEFSRALRLRPGDVWSNFYQGLCAFDLGRLNEAAAAFRTCLALRPDSAVLWYNMAMTQEAQGRSVPAFEHYSRALDLDPTLVEAYLNRGVLSLQAGRNTEALQDFDRGVRAARVDRPTRSRLHLNRALARLETGDRAGALIDAEAAVAAGNAEARALRDALREGRPLAPLRDARHGQAPSLRLRTAPTPAPTPAAR